VRVRQANGKHPAPYAGASVLAGMAAFRGQWIMRAEFGEIGPALVHRKWCGVL
jgi:actin-related protein